ncbi:MAG: hypothetical protein E6I97_27370 [Chloroflexi bacterium]|nr:MAG: hypothetical protein E6I97_27370 [Chloroflexota bacterium]
MRAVPHAEALHMHLALPDPSVKWQRHESAMRPWPPSANPHRWEHASGRQTADLGPHPLSSAGPRCGVRTRSCAFCIRESQEGCSHARSTSPSHLVAHPVG